IDVLRYPGSDIYARAILMASQLLRSSSDDQLSTCRELPVLRTSSLLVAWPSATLRQPAPSPILHLLWLRTPLPNFPVRAPAAGAFTEDAAH
ncbi:hypothetical protein ACFY0N_39470, partial [Streptomyces vinaceus]